jgi:hypothetical protein
VVGLEGGDTSGGWGMSNFRQIDRQTGFLLPPSVDEWLPERHLARFVVEADRRAGPADVYWQLSRVGFGAVPPGDAAGSVGLWLCDRGVFEPETGASDVRFGGVSVYRSQ